MVDIIRRKRAEKEADTSATSDATEPTFEPPEVVAEREISEPIKPGSSQAPDRQGKHWWSRRSKREKILLIVLALLIVVAAVLVGMKVLRPAPPPVVEQQQVVEPPKSTTEASRLTGVQVKPELNKLPVTGVMIENSPDARPQAGLKDAGVVFEAIAEGGITRFLALFQEAQPKYVGPIRSVRPYYIRWALGFDAAIAHVGGSPQALKDMRNLHARDLDQFANAGSYDRVNTRFAPHNVYTSLSRLLSLEKKKGWTSSDFIGFDRKDEAPVKKPKAETINITISSPLYGVHYNYDDKANSYDRIMAGTPHKDDKSGKQITPKVVVALVTSQGYASDGLHTTYKTTGSGQVYVFQDGTVIVGRWEKKSEKSRLAFTRTDGTPLALNAGQTWITVVGSKAAVSYKP